MSLSLVHYYPRAWIGDGGCSSAVRGWASSLADAGARVRVVCDGSGEPPPIRHVRWLTVPHRTWGRVRFPVGLERMIGRGDLLVLHSAWAYHNVRAAWSAVRAGVPYLLTPHGAYDPNVFRRRRTTKRLWWNVFEHRLVSRARAIHVFFEEQREQLRELGYMGPVVVAPNGLTVPALEPRPSRSRVLLWMGRFDIETKGIDLLLHALASLPPDLRPHARLHGPDWRGGKQQVRQLVDHLGLGDHVTLGPALYDAEKWDALSDCGLFIFPSRWEGQGLMALEAAAAGAPMVVTNTTSVGRHLAAARAAILVEPTPESIAEGIVSGCTSQTAELGAQASQFVRERFSWSGVAGSYAEQVSALL